MMRTSAIFATILATGPLAALACARSGDSNSSFDGGRASSASGSASSASSSGSTASGSGSSLGGTGPGMFGTGSSGGSDAASDGSLLGNGEGLPATVRDFKFYDATDPTTVPDFENPPYNVGEDGGSNQGYTGPWDDQAIVTATLGPDNKPVYAAGPGGTLTTHGPDDFDKWYNDVSGTTIDIPYMLPIVPMQDDGGSMAVGYDSNVQGVPYDIPGMTGGGFFPIDGQGFGNQGKPHNYSFTMELHTVFTYRGGETFEFRGDDDVYVYIDKKLVINLGGVHGPETADVQVDTLGLTVGQDYPLDFFSAERHVTGSNIKFETTLALRPVVN